jgi:hypothetical protein
VSSERSPCQGRNRCAETVSDDAQSIVGVFVRGLLQFASNLVFHSLPVFQEPLVGQTALADIYLSEKKCEVYSEVVVGYCSTEGYDNELPCVV